MKNGVFISYARADARQADAVVRSLKNTLELDVWYDQRMPGGVDYIAEIEKEIQKRAFLVFIASERSFASDWCRTELKFAKDQHRQIVTVFIEDCPVPPGEGLAISTFAGNHIYWYKMGEQEFEACLRASALGRAAENEAPKRPVPKNQEELEKLLTQIEEMLDGMEFSEVIRLIGVPEDSPLFSRASDLQLARVYRYLMLAERQIRWSKNLSGALIRPFSGHSYSCACRYGLQEELTRLNARLCENIKAFVFMEVDLDDAFSYGVSQPDQCREDWYYLWECFLYRTGNLNAAGGWKPNGEIEELRRWYTAFEQFCPDWLLKGGSSWIGVRTSGRVARYFEALETLAAQHNGSEEYERAMALRRDGRCDEEAVLYLRQAAEKEHAEARYELGLCYVYGEGVREDLKEAARLFRLAAEQGLIEAQRELARCYKYGEGVAPNGREAVGWYCRAAEQGDVWAQYLAGECYDDGEGVEEDKPKAIQWFHRAAQQGHARAQYRLARFYDYGWSVAVDKREACRWYREAAEQGLPEAQNALGVAYSFGDGVPEDKTEGVRWYRLAAEADFAYAQYNLAMCFDHGNGVQENKAEAMRWYRLAADQNDPDAQYSLGIGLLRGIGVKRDEAEGMRYLRLAEENGSGRAVNYLRHHRRVHPET